MKNAPAGIRNRFGRLAVLVIAILVRSALAEVSSVGTEGLSATYQLAADADDRPEYERQHKETVTELMVTVGPSQQRHDQAYQWVELAFSKRNGERFSLRLLLDRLPGGRTPHVARYIWSEPQWGKPLEYVDANSGTGLLPRMGLWQRGWPKGLPEAIAAPHDFPTNIQFLGYPFERVAVRHDASLTVPSTKRLRLNPDWTLFTIQPFHYHGKPHWRLTPQQMKTRYTREHYTELTAAGLRQMMDLGMNLIKASNEKLLDIWQEPVFVFRVTRPWPEILYRSNFFGRYFHLNEPTVHHRGQYNDNRQVIDTWTAAQLAQSLESKISSLMTTWRGYGLWRDLKKNYGLGNLPRYMEPIPAWDRNGTWYVMAGQAGGVVVEGTGLGADLRSLNMHYRSQIPHTAANRRALATAILRGAARNFHKVWGVSFYDMTAWPDVLDDMEYAYLHGATHIWLWGGWPDVDADYPHQYKLAMFEALQNIARRHGPRDMRKLLHRAKVAVVLPRGYSMGLYNGTFFETWWMHSQRRNKHDLVIRDVMHNAYIEAERLLRKGTVFDIVVDHKLNKRGYDQYIYILENGQVRIEHGGEQTVIDGPRIPVRPDFGPGPKITARFLDKPSFAGDPLTIEAVIKLGNGAVARPRGHKRLGQQVRWNIAAGTLYRPDSFSRGIYFELKDSRENHSLLSGDWTYKWSQQDNNLPGTYRVRLATIDEFARSDETWLEFTVKNRFTESPVTAFPTVWKFRLDPQDIGAVQKWFAADFDDASWPDIKVPAWWEKAGFGDYDGVAWYRCHFEIPASAGDKTIYLAFGAVDGDALIYLNGKEMGRHNGNSAHTWDKPFEMEVSRFLRYGRTNQLTVRVHDTEALGGIFKPVRLLTRQNNH